MSKTITSIEKEELGGLAKRVNVNDKRLVNCNAVDVNQLVPIKYKWAWEHYLNGCANNWLPNEVQMAKDIELWKSSRLSDDERRVILRNLGFFSTAESLVGNNIVLTIFKHITNPEARQYLLRQAFEEAVHTHTFLYICESLALDEKAVFNAYNELPSIHRKDAFQMKLTEEIFHPDFSTETVEGLQKLLKNLIGYYVIMEGIFFYSGFVMILSFHRQNKMTGIGEQYQYILRDETIHLNFGIDLINGIKEENPNIWTSAFENEILEMIQEAVKLEIEYAEDCLPTGILGLKSSMFIDYVQHIADRRMERIGMKILYGSKNPFPWMSETMDLAKEKNFFETRVTEYQTSASLSW
ncbi:ribonucleotide-diphosphate reductase subunit beta [Candidatus Clavichlamydia salmonicola]|uniref:ribonucleotide-diphosphate reductase subunit beta n=1 Tax=Candidatus Clavichlamydia salmonicola TaxID=469812 RepID=UPI0038993187